MPISPANASGLVEFVPMNTDDPRVFVFGLRNIDGSTFATAVNADGLASMLTGCLSVAQALADDPDLAVPEWSGSHQALAASHVELDAGRAPTECALRVFLGRIELVFLLPVDSMVAATATFVGRLGGGLPASKQ